MSGRNAPRSKKGCSTCRRRKVKCDEDRPACQRCLNLSLSCEWDPKRDKPARGSVRELQPARRLWTPPNDLETIKRLNHPLVANYANTLMALRPPPADWPGLPMASRSPFYHQISEPNIPWANSLVLSEHDRKYFQYFPSSSVVFYYMKKWQWSSFNYLYQGPAATSKVIMRMILALSASDMHRNGLLVQPPGRHTAEDHARYHYGAAVTEFRQLLETPRGRLTPAELDMVFVAMFLMITYEWQFGHSVRHLQLHLQGVRSLLETHPDLLHIKDVNDILLSQDAEQLDEPVNQVTLIPEQLFLWILYVDVSCRPMGSTESLFDYVLQTQNPALHPDRLHRCARLWGRCYWGKEYPESEVADDMENYRGLELLHEGMMLRYKLWKILSDDPNPSEDISGSHFAEMMAVRDRFSDLFITAKLAPATSTRRTLVTINMAVATFYSHIIFHRRLLCPPGPPSTLQRQAIRNSIEILQKQHSSDSKLLRRLHWPLLAVVIETEDSVQREWLRERLSELRVFHAECLWAHEIAEQVLAKQDASTGNFADLGAVLRTYNHASSSWQTAATIG